MKRTLIATTAVLILLVSGIAAAEAFSSRVTFTPVTDDYVVRQDGVVVGIYDSEEEAAEAATEIKLADEQAVVLYGRRTLQRADLVAAPDSGPTTPPTTGAATSGTPESETTGVSTVEVVTSESPTAEPTTTTTESGATTTAGPTPSAPTSSSQNSTPTSSSPSTSKPDPRPVDADLVWGYDDSRPDASWNPPALGGSYNDPNYGSRVRRVSSADGTRFNRNTYSRRQAENAGGTLFMTYHGSARYHVYDRSTLDLVADLDIDPNSEPQWHPTDPNVIRHVAGANSYVGDLRLHEVDVRTGQATVVADLTERIQRVLPNALYLQDRAEGAPSADGDRYAWLIYDGSEEIIGIVSYDLSTDSILGVKTDFEGPNLDWVSMSPNGRHVLGGYWDGTWAYDADLGNARRLTPTGEHSDIAINAAGNDAYVHIDFSAGPNGGWLMSVDLETMVETRIFDLYDDANTSIHISGKGYNKPGWVVASTYSCKVGHAWSCHKVMAVELAPNGRVLNLAHTYNCGDGYWTETHAVVNRDFTRVYFNSDSGSCGIDAEVFEIQVPSFR